MLSATQLTKFTDDVRTCTYSSEDLIVLYVKLGVIIISSLELED